MSTLSANNDANPQNLPATTEVGKSTVIGQLQETMDSMAYDVLVDLYNWANLWDDLYNGKATELTEPRQRAMLRPFTGFGQHPAVWETYSAGLIPLITNQTLIWMGDANYRKANKLSLLILQHCAPALSAQTKGMESSFKAIEILKKADG